MKNMKTLILILALLIAYLFLENNLIDITKLKYVSDKLPAGFDGCKIVHLSDLHSKEYGKSNWILISLIKTIKPELIVVTGDLINSDYYDEASIIEFMKNLKNIAPVFFVTGNHEIANRSFDDLAQKLIGEDIRILRNSAAELHRNGDSLLLIGMDDPITTNRHENSFISKYLSKGINKVLSSVEGDYFKILLTHRPEQLPLYAQYNMDLIFAGHAHGGQIRIPFICGLYAPNQGLFPKYTSGGYKEKNSTMIVSRGLGNGSFPQRIFNRPQIIVTTLYKDN